MLSFEQFQELRKQGLTVDQITKFEEEDKSSTSTEQRPNLPQQIATQGQTNLSSKLTQRLPSTDIAIGAAKGALSTLQGFDTLARKIPGVGNVLNKINPVNPGSDAALSNFLESKNTFQSIGKGAEQIAEFFIPASTISKAGLAVDAITKAPATASLGTKLFTSTARLAGRASAEAIGAGAMTAVQTGGDTNATKDAVLISGAIPIVGRGLSVIKNKVIPAVASVATGVPKETLKLAKNHPEAMDKALKHLSENPQQPFYALANTISSKLSEGLKTAEEGYVKGVEALRDKVGNRRYNISTQFSQIKDTLQNFNLGIRDNLQTGSLEVLRKAQTPFSNRELAIFDDLVNSFEQSKKIALDDVIDLRRKISNAYNAMPFSPDGKPTSFHAVIEALSEKTDDIINKTIPELKSVNEAYANVRKVYSEFAPKLIDSQGALKQGAEQYLANLPNVNKGAARDSVAKLEELTGIPVVDNTVLLKAAQQLDNLFPATGSRTQDILRSLVVSGVGFGTGGLLGGAAGLVATSPKIVGRAAITAGKLSNKIPKIKVPADLKRRIFGN